MVPNQAPLVCRLPLGALKASIGSLSGQQTLEEGLCQHTALEAARAASAASAMCSLDILIAGKYRLGRKLGGGSFGEIFLGTNLQTGEEVGIKLVSNRSLAMRDLLPADHHPVCKPHICVSHNRQHAL